MAVRGRETVIDVIGIVQRGASRFQCSRKCCENKWFVIASLQVEYTRNSKGN